MPRLKDRYKEEIVPAMVKEFDYSNVNQVPRITKVVVNGGLGEALVNAKALEKATDDIVTITGPRPGITRAQKSIAVLRLREGNPIGI